MPSGRGAPPAINNNLGSVNGATQMPDVVVEQPAPGPAPFFPRGAPSSGTGTGSGAGSTGTGGGSAGAGTGPVNNPATSGAIPKLQYPSDRPKYFMTFTVSAYHRTSLLNVGTLTPSASVVLPLPRSLVDNLQIAYDQTPIGAVVGLGAEAIGFGKEWFQDQSQSKTIGATGSPVTGQVPPVSSQGGTFESFTSKAAAIGARALGGAGDAISAMTCYSPNQFLTILLKGPEYKRHRFSWIFSPNTAEESTNIDLIIRQFKEWGSPGLTAAGALFSFPMIFQIAFMPNEKFMYKFKPAVLESVTVDYTPNEGAAFYRGSNAPESLAVTFQFLELEFWLAGRGDFNP